MALRRRRSRSKLTKQGEPGETRQKRREARYEAQEGRCHEGWGCGRAFPLFLLQEAHLKNLGMGSSRHNSNDPRNKTTVLLCDTCHRHQEAVVREMHRLWKSGYGDWVDPVPDNAHIVFEAIENGLKVERNEV